MRIITYSDLHLEFGSGWMLPPIVNGDVMILAGDIITLRDYDPLDQLLRKWKKPVLYVTGNHEYYARRPMNEEDHRFKAWLEDRHPHVKLLFDEEVNIGGVNFFGGTMWTDFTAAICAPWRPPALKSMITASSITPTKRLSRQQIRLRYIKTSRRNC
jgi:hypothetical protein